MGEIIKPMDIEKESFRIISEELGQIDLNDKELLVLKRVIHKVERAAQMWQLLLLTLCCIRHLKGRIWKNYKR